MSLADRLARRLARSGQKDPYEGLPTDELSEPVLPRWFVLLAVATVPVAIALFVLAFFGFDRGETPVAERRPPPAGGLTSDVGEVVVGDRDPVAHEPACDEVAGFRVAGTELDRALLGAGLDALCDAPWQPVGGMVAIFADSQPVLRFAAFEATGADITGTDDVVYVNARYSQTPPDLIAPLVAYQAVLVTGDAAEAETVLIARAAEFVACETVVAEPGRACGDAAELLGLDDPAAELRDAGFE